MANLRLEQGEILEAILIKVYMLKDSEIWQGLWKLATTAPRVVMIILDPKRREKIQPGSWNYMPEALDTGQPKPREKMKHHGTYIWPWDDHETKR